MRTLATAVSAFAILLGAMTPLAVLARETSDRPAAEAVIKHFGYYVRDNGMWKQMNEDHVEGEQTPVMWVKRFGFEMAGNVMVDRTYAVFENNACLPIIMVVLAAERDTGRFRTAAFAENGLQFSGTVSVVGDHASERIVEGRVSDEMTIRFRELTDTSDPERFEARAFDPDGDGWTYRDSRSWTFDASLDLCR